MRVETAYGIVSIAAAVVAFVVTALLGKPMIPWLTRLKYGQSIKEIGPTWHSSKAGTPMMGGLMFIAGTVAACAVCLPTYFSLVKDSVTVDAMHYARLFGGIGLGVFSALIGFADDFTKVAKHENTGLTAIQKYLLQLVVAAAYLLTLFLAGRAEGVNPSETFIPFVGTVDTGIWFYIVSIVMITGFINAVNLTDGIDGLCSSVTFFAMVALMLMAAFYSVFDMGIIAAAVAGGCIGFLVWNFNPAKVFMGDTGSLFLGGMFCAVAYGTGFPILIPLVGIIYLIEAFSVIIQRYYFKLTHGKRIFKMSPIHHHYEMSGWSENKIVAVFSAVTVVGGIAAVLLATLSAR